MDQMLIDDLIHVFPIHIGVPDCFRIDHDHRAFAASVQTSREIDAGLAFAGETEFLHAPLGVVAHLLRAVVIAAVLAVIALIAAKENVMMVKGHGSLAVLETAAIIGREP